ncbi:MAG: hypothetical protein NC409_12650 [Clostridium sp.]|nr:hypothetical protein [Clostridium sp.]
MAYINCNLGVGNNDLPEEYTMTISGSASRGGNINVGRQPSASVSGTFPWSILSSFYDTCTITCSASQSPHGNPSVSGAGTRYREDMNSDIQVRAGANGLNTSEAWSFNATFTARFYNR